MNEKTARLIRNFSEKNDIAISIHAPWSYTFASGQPEVWTGILESLRHMCRLALACGSTRVVIHAGTVDHMTFDEDLKAYTNNMVDVFKLGREVGVNFVVETVPLKRMLFLSDPKKLLIASRGLPEMKFCLDTGHVNMGGDTTETYKLLAEKIAHAHIHDNDGSADQHKAIGDGNIDFETLLRLFSKNKFHGPFIMENHGGFDVCKKSKERFLKIWDSI